MAAIEVAAEAADLAGPEGTPATDGQKCGQYLTVTSSVPTYLPTAAKVVTVLRQIMRYRHENEVCALTVLLINLIDLKVFLLIAGELGLLSFKGPFLTKLYCDSMIL